MGIVASDLVKNIIFQLFFLKDEKNIKDPEEALKILIYLKILTSLNGYFDKFGGHKMACGLNNKNWKKVR